MKTFFPFVRCLGSRCVITVCSLSAAFVVSACGVTQPVRVIDQGTSQAAVSLGGPLIPFGGMTVPTPYLNLGLIHGYKDNLTLTGNVHVTMALLKNAAFDVGAATRLVRESNGWPELTAKGQLYFFSDLERLDAVRVFPMVSINASYLLGRSTLLYAGAEQLIQFNKPQYFFTPFAGTQLSLSDRSALQIELKWMTANANSAHGIFRGTGSIGDHGDLGLFFGYTYGLSR
ncbi:MAG: hypothetical protein NTZ35_08725 [Ignavibacteriales bacterium]|nr:hypothetical protein [Ignavibacteriales bacterium]